MAAVPLIAPKRPRGESDTIKPKRVGGHKMKVSVIGAGIGAQYIGGDPDRYEWRVSYQREGRGQYFHRVSSQQAQSSMEAIEVAKRELGEED